MTVFVLSALAMLALALVLVLPVLLRGTGA